MIYLPERTAGDFEYGSFSAAFRRYTPDSEIDIPRTAPITEE